MTHDNQNTEHETEIARLRREHAAMVDLLRTFANKVIPSRITLASEYYAGYYDAYEAVQSDVNDVLQAIDSNPDTPPAGVTGSGARYVPRKNESIRNLTEFVWGAWNLTTEEFAGGVFTEAEIQAECDRLNAAHPASGTDTVAGSGNGGEA